MGGGMRGAVPDLEDCWTPKSDSKNAQFLSLLSCQGKQKHDIGWRGRRLPPPRVLCVQINSFHPTLHSLSVLSRRPCNSAHTVIHTIHSFLQLPLDRCLSTPARREHDLVWRQTTRETHSHGSEAVPPARAAHREQLFHRHTPVALLPTNPFPYLSSLPGSPIAAPPRSGFAGPSKRQPRMSPSHGGRYGTVLWSPGTKPVPTLSLLYYGGPHGAWAIILPNPHVRRLPVRSRSPGSILSIDPPS
jgi:hypothetical protein